MARFVLKLIRDFFSVMKRGALGCCLCLAAFLCLSLTSSHLSADQFNKTQTYLPAFPNQGKYRAVIIGDSFAKGLWQGLSVSSDPLPDLTISHLTLPGYGIVSPAKFGWEERVKDTLSSNQFEIAIIMMGAYDRKPMMIGKGKWVKTLSKPWVNHYKARTLKLLQILKQHKIAVYWIGLPVMRGPKTNAYARRVNELLRGQSLAQQTKFIDIGSKFAAANGGFVAWGAGNDGKSTVLRAKDGIHFTYDGNSKLAYFIEKYIGRDIAEAKSQRSIKLAGSKRDLKVLYSSIAGPEKGLPDYMKKSSQLKPDKKGPSTTASITQQIKKKQDKQPEQTSTFQEETGTVLYKFKKGQEKVDAQTKISLYRPQFRLSLESQVQYGQKDPNKNILKGRFLRAKTNPQLMAGYYMTSLNNDILLMNSKTRKPLSQTPYFQVLIEGRAAGSKAGRADDFSLPKNTKP